MDRRITVEPDPATGVCHREDIVQAFMDMEAVLHVNGGVVSIVTQRFRDPDMPQMAYTTRVILQWKDRSDGHQNPKPEQTVTESSLRRDEATEALLDPESYRLDDEEPDDIVKGEVIVDEDGEPVEDISAIPEPAR